MSMRDLKTLREGWKEMRRVEANLPTDLTCISGMSQFKQLWMQFAPLLEQTEAIYQGDREHHLAVFQKRLLSLVKRKNQ